MPRWWVGARGHSPGVPDRLRHARGSSCRQSQPPAKPHCIVIDFAGNSGQHRLVHATDILGGDEPDEVLDRAYDIVDKGVTSDVAEAIEIAKVEIEEEEKEKARRKLVKAAKVSYKTNESDPFSALGVRRDSAKFMPNSARLEWQSTGNAGKSRRRLSCVLAARTSNSLHGEFINGESRRRSARSSRLKVLNKYGFKTGNMSFKEASSLLDQLAKNNWKPMAG
jgi:hypothetical protein